MKVDLLGVRESLEEHCRPGQIAFMLFELLESADYSRDEIRDVVATMKDLTEGETDEG